MNSKAIIKRYRAFGGFAVTTGEAYAALGLDPSSATPDEARLRFREIVRSNHPDGKPLLTAE